MPSRQAASGKKKDGTDKKKRDWGKGLATAGRTKTCTLVPINHFGSIPGKLKNANPLNSNYLFYMLSFFTYCKKLR